MTSQQQSTATATITTPSDREIHCERVTTNSTLGPGTRMSTNAMNTKASRCSVGNMSRAYRRWPRETAESNRREA